MLPTVAFKEMLNRSLDTGQACHAHGVVAASEHLSLRRPSGASRLGSALRAYAFAARRAAASTAAGYGGSALRDAVKGIPPSAEPPKG